jgi:HPt (histidine-containing phosphotransfer) domain-containing protein
VIEDLRQRFLPRFVQSGRERAARALEALETAQGSAVAAAELHALAGEAAILELSDIAGLAREGEKAARSAPATAPREKREECARLLRRIAAAVEALVPVR